jgi:hypothetical protein
VGARCGDGPDLGFFAHQTQMTGDAQTRARGTADRLKGDAQRNG